jgi:RPA family protein
VCGAPAERVAELERTLREVLATIPTSDEVATWDRIANDSDRTWSLEHAKRREERARKAAEAAAARAELERADSPEVREARDSAAAEALARAKDGDA